jgi:hypothetical protein
MSKDPYSGKIATAQQRACNVSYQTIRRLLCTLAPLVTAVDYQCIAASIAWYVLNAAFQIYESLGALRSLSKKGYTGLRLL